MLHQPVEFNQNTLVTDMNNGKEINYAQPQEINQQYHQQDQTTQQLPQFYENSPVQQQLQNEVQLQLQGLAIKEKGKINLKKISKIIF